MSHLHVVPYRVTRCPPSGEAMSRKREKQRESKRELARQLGVDPDEVPEELRSHARVSEPEMKARLTVRRAKRGLFRRARRLALHVALFVVDAAGPRLARFLSLRGATKSVPGDVALTIAEDRGEEKVRYTRPGHFLILALVVEGGDDDEDIAHASALADVARLRVDVGDGPQPLGRLGAARLERPAGARLFIDDKPVPEGADLTFHAAAARSVAAAHRVHETIELPLASVDGALEATLALDLRV